MQQTNQAPRRRPLEQSRPEAKHNEKEYRTMSRKIYAAFVPLLAVVAFASVTGAAQAAPHWYKCEAKAGGKYHDPDCTEKTGTAFELTRLPFEKEGVLTRKEVSTFGKLTLSVPSVPLTATCNVLDEGLIWNVSEATAGKDEITVFENHKCKATACTGTLAIAAENLPYPTELTEVVAGTIRDKIGTTAKEVTIKVTCSSPVLSETFKGILEPKFVNGSPSFVEFDSGAGHLTGPTLGEAKVSGKDFVAETETGDNIDAVNP